MVSNASQRSASSGRMSFMPRTACSLLIFLRSDAGAAGILPGVGAGHVGIDDAAEIRRDVVALQCDRLLAVLEHRRHRRLTGAGQLNADVGVLALAGAVDDAAHDS